MPSCLRHELSIDVFLTRLDLWWSWAVFLFCHRVNVILKPLHIFSVELQLFSNSRRSHSISIEVALYLCMSLKLLPPSPMPLPKPSMLPIAPPSTLPSPQRPLPPDAPHRTGGAHLGPSPPPPPSISKAHRRHSRHPRRRHRPCHHLGRNIRRCRASRRVGGPFCPLTPTSEKWACNGHFPGPVWS